MASEVDICNMALSHLGDAATVSSISPPDGSAQAGYCATFYPIARDALLEMFQWSFITRRAALAQITNISSTWAYCYALPANLADTISVLDPAASDDNSAGIAYNDQWCEVPVANLGVYTPQPYVIESADDGTPILYTNMQNAVLRYTVKITDPSRFSSMFVMTLSRALSALLAGPILKGEAGTAESARQQVIAYGQDGKSGLFAKAAAQDANGQRANNVRDRQQVAWINGR